jgi:peptidoglycan hydrolase FlgJ
VSTNPLGDVRNVNDFAGLNSLKNGARQNDPATLRAVARQFESLFARMMIKSMRDAVGTDPIFGSDQEKMYQSMFDDQLALEMTRGRGLGLADMLVRQLQRNAEAAAPGAAAAPTAANTTAALSPGSAAGAADAPASAATQSQFVNDVWPAAQAAAQQLGVDPSSLIAQAALESNWGRSVPRDAGGTSSNNLFGIKADATWDGGSTVATTHEVQNGTATATRAAFRSYNSSGESFQDYVTLLRSSPRYAAALNTGNNVQAFATALQRGGYATDPDYVRKVSSLAGNLANTLAATLAQSPALKSAAAEPITGRTGLL